MNVSAEAGGKAILAEALGLTGHVHTSAASTMARIRAFLR